MADSTVELLNDIAGASPAGIQATDLLYVFRPGSPDLDFKADGDDLQTLVLGGTVSVSAFARTILDDADAAAARATIGAGVGDTAGAASSTDNAVVRFDGTGGKTLQNSGVSIDDNDKISGFKAQFNDQTGTSYTLVAGDTGKTVTLTNASAITVTLPNSLAAGFTCELIQGGAGQVTLSAAGGATLSHRQSHTKIAGQHGSARLVVTANSGGSSAVYNLAGDTSA